jgi:hypothetical protein
VAWAIELSFRLLIEDGARQMGTHVAVGHEPLVYCE